MNNVKSIRSKSTLISAALFWLVLLSPITLAGSTKPSIIPEPVSMKVNGGSFVINEKTVICGVDDTEKLARKLRNYLSPATGYDFEMIEAKKQPDNSIVLKLDKSLSRLGEEGYRLKVTKSGVVIEAPQKAGIFYGVQSLRQLLPVQIFRGAKVRNVKWTVPCLEITDMPRFKWRGLHLDVGRHFMPKEFVKKYINLIALHKMNKFHFHLTEDQGWRIEIKKYPKLTEVGAWRKETLIGHGHIKPWKFDGKKHGGFYTQDDIREIVQYAKDRYVTVVPEIEMPGHSQAAIAAYTELGVTGKKLDVLTYWGVNEDVMNANESTILFMQDVLSEVLELFDSEFIHIGGDEVPKTQWTRSAEIQARMKELGLKDEHELQSYFIKRMDTFLTQKGRRLVGWDEILEGGLAPGATVMSWRGEAGGIAAAKAGHDVVMAPTTYTYFDYYQSKDKENEPLAIGGFLPLEKVYRYNPIPKE